MLSEGPIQSKKSETCILLISCQGHVSYSNLKQTSANIEQQLNLSQLPRKTPNFSYIWDTSGPPNKLSKPPLPSFCSLFFVGCLLPCQCLTIVGERHNLVSSMLSLPYCLQLGTPVVNGTSILFDYCFLGLTTDAAKNNEDKER